jgi:hypothetical protein
VRGQVRKFVEGLMRASMVLQYLGARLEKFRQCVMEMKEVLITPMDKHRFHYVHTCEDIFT